MDIEEALKYLKSVGRIEDVRMVKSFEGHRIGRFDGHRTNKKGDLLQVEVKLSDMGLKNPLNRYVCHVAQEDGKEATGNNMSTIVEAIAVVHWRDLG